MRDIENWHFAKNTKDGSPQVLLCYGNKGVIMNREFAADRFGRPAVVYHVGYLWRCLLAHKLLIDGDGEYDLEAQLEDQLHEMQVEGEAGNGTGFTQAMLQADIDQLTKDSDYDEWLYEQFLEQFGQRALDAFLGLEVA